MTDPGRQRETKYLLTINRPCAYIHFRFKAALVCILIKVIAELCFLEKKISNILSVLKKYPSRRQLYHRSIVS